MVLAGAPGEGTRKSRIAQPMAQIYPMMSQMQPNCMIPIASCVFDSLSYPTIAINTVPRPARMRGEEKYQDR